MVGQKFAYSPALQQNEASSNFLEEKKIKMHLRQLKVVNVAIIYILFSLGFQYPVQKTIFKHDVSNFSVYILKEGYFLSTNHTGLKGLNDKLHSANSCTGTYDCRVLHYSTKTVSN